ncbi:DegT/DnrJ/EryC1/StrS aminotransferase family protein [Candidatus Saccharibacteria bacterium]|nr:DegT/DnrJ/EryC1/StrS aminotransferase family protein [Candidatus Saccharibacteria bacterium]
MSRKYFLGLNANGPKVYETLFSCGSSKNLRDFNELLAGKYQGAPILTKNGRSALTIALKSYFEPGDKIIVNGFTCYAVYEAVVKAGMTPIFVDISKNDLNFNVGILEKIINKNVKGVIIQNSLGNTVDMEAMEKFAKKHNLVLIEDLAHSAGMKYPDGRETGTVGAATVLSFGKDKSINTITGGAVILRAPVKHKVKAPFKAPQISEVLRARFYPLFCAVCRGLSYVHLGGVLMRFLILTHQVEKSADNKLDLSRRPPKFVAKLAMKQIKGFHHRGQPKLREFYLIRNREEALLKLQKAGFYFNSFWYEKPVSPARYYKKVQFPEKDCPEAVRIAEQIINFPTYYKKQDLGKAHEIIKPYLIGGKDD